MKLVRWGVPALCLAIIGLAPVGHASPSQGAGKGMAVDKSSNLKHLHQFKYEGGTELAAVGDYVYSGEMNGTTNRGQDANKGGMRIFSVKNEKFKEAGMLKCPGNDNDVEVISKNLVALGFHTNVCAPGAGNGFMIVDVSKPSRPRVLSELATGKNHTFKPVPGTKLIYTAGGGLSGGPAAGPAIVDVSNPRKPEVVARPQTITMDCHDISFSIVGETKLGFCAGAIGTGEVQIWDISDPLAPVTIGRIVNPLIQYSHYAVASSDGTLLAIDDEAFAAHDCNTGHSPTGRVWIYDLTVPQAPVPLGSMAAPRGGDGSANIGTLAGWVPSWCLSHGLDWQPGTHNLAVTWFTGGFSVLDLSDPRFPVEAAHFQADDSLTYSALWHDGLLYTNDMGRGVDVFKIKGLSK